MLRTRLQITGFVTGPSVITHYWGASEDATGVTAVATALSTFLTAIKARVSTSCSFALDPTVDVLSPGGVLEDILPGTMTAVVGTSAGAQLPPSNQWLIRWRTGTYVTSEVAGKPPRTHELRGRTFIPGPTVTTTSGGAPIAGDAAVLTTAAQALADDTSAQLMVWSPTHTLGVSVKTGTCWSKYAILRSRRD